MSKCRPDSELSRINRNAARQSVIVELTLLRLIQDSIRHSEETGGAFDITAGLLLKSWGFFRGRGRVPDEAEIAQVLQAGPRKACFPRPYWLLRRLRVKHSLRPFTS